MYEFPEDHARRHLIALQNELAACRRAAPLNLSARLLPHVCRLNRRLEAWLARRAHLDLPTSEPLP